ncbi:hypothetical protein ACFL6H_09950, partial [Candidatus Latescibacterota bacterium]
LLEYKLRNLRSTPDELFDQDMSQLYLLITNEKFKIKFVSKLRDMFFKTIELAGACWVFTIVITVVLRAF